MFIGAGLSSRKVTAELIRPALLWSLGHGLLILWFFRHTLRHLAGDVIPTLQLPLFIGFVIQGLFLGLVAFVVALPLLALRRGFAIAAPLLISLITAFFYLDSLVYEFLGFHINGLVLAVAMQPGGGLAETGLPAGEVAFLLGGIAFFVGVDTWIGSLFVRRFASTGRSWSWALAILLLWGAERIGSAVLIFAGGPSAELATTTLPLQPLLRMNQQLARLSGREPVRELSLGGLPQVGTPMGQLRSTELTLHHSPDIVFLLIESLPVGHLSAETMPNLSRRTEGGTSFTRHYSAAASTQFSLFSILFGLDAQRRDAVVAAGRTPLLFPALQSKGYDLRFLAASSVDWMDLKETVFRDVADGLETDYRGDGQTRDRAMIDQAKTILAEAPADQPLFLFLFFAGTHFNYTYPDDAARFEPAWDGSGSIKASRIDPGLVLNRSKNSAWEVDRKVEELLLAYEASRGAKPLLIVTGDHGEEFSEDRLGHSSDVSVEQLHVPMVIWDETLPPGRVDVPTGHVDLLPTLLSLLGDEHDPALYSDGMPMQLAPADRYVLSIVGWTRKFALIGEELKVSFLEGDTSLRGVRISDPDDGPLPDGEARFVAETPKLLRRLRGQSQPRALSVAP